MRTPLGERDIRQPDFNWLRHRRRRPSSLGRSCSGRRCGHRATTWLLSAAAGSFEAAGALLPPRQPAWRSSLGGSCSTACSISSILLIAKSNLVPQEDKASLLAAPAGWRQFSSREKAPHTAGRLAAAMAWPWRLSFSSGTWKAMRPPVRGIPPAELLWRAQNHVPRRGRVLASRPGCV